jgi:uncharacterized membrane protein
VAAQTRHWTDQVVEEWIGNLLRAGVTLSTAVVLFGACVYLARHGHEMPHYKVFVGTPENLRSVSGIWKNVLAFKGQGLIQLGLLLLIATPVARVAFSVVAFAIQRDRLYVVVTLLVLVILTYSLIGGRL